MTRGRGSLRLAGLMMVLIAALLQLPQTFSLKETARHHSCAPSCGNLTISHPFRLKGDPPNCGSPWPYELSCENNSTVLYLFGGKFFVRQINNSRSTIRVVDAGIFDHQKDNHSAFIPHYFLNHANFSMLSFYTTDNLNLKGSFWPSASELSNVTVILKCQKAVNSPSYHVYLNTSTCSDNYGSASSSNSSLISHSKPYYTYVKVGKTNVMDVENSCKIEQMSLTSWPGRIPSPNISCTDLRNIFLYGFELSWIGSDELKIVKHIGLLSLGTCELILYQEMLDGLMIKRLIKTAICFYFYFIFN
ncbi:hypothetical protein F2P56_031167 [Juglans regia]|uniref:Wall-associated receptor kinase galacturonan-binding domain-containing protein n=1 Tax=Juglans regia TaxID=51240 RepID=A0A833X8M3_JUGRE|nr:hypothetical protein F2P56_031167 [Juglans regia]